MQPAIAKSRARTLQELSRTHKRAIRQHRRELRRTQRELEALRAQCAEFGIDLIGEAEDPQHGRMSRQPND